MSPDKRGELFASLAKGLAGSLKHQHSKTRLFALQAIAALVQHSGNGANLLGLLPPDQA